MLKFLKSASATKPTAGASTEPTSAAAPPKSRLNQLLEKPAAKPATGLDVDLLSGLSLPARGAGSEEAAKGKGHRPKRPRPDDVSCDAPVVDSFDITLSPLAAAPAASARARDRGLDRESSIGLAGVLGGFRGRDSAGSITSSSSTSLKKTSATKGRSKTPAVTTNTTNGSKAKRQSIDFGGSGSGSSSSIGGGGGGGSGNSYGRGSAVAAKGKMGPWLSRPGETAICAEDGYDPLDLIHDANKELFGNDDFRGVQEDVRFL